MKGYKSEAVRNIAVLGHGGCGKTTFLEAAPIPIPGDSGRPSDTPRQDRY